MSADLAIMSGREAASAIRSGKVTASDVAKASLDRIETLNPDINAYTLVTADRALAEADAVDKAFATGDDPGPLAGVTFSVKNLFDLAGEVTLAGSKINVDDPPAARDATSVERLCAAGAICLGATNMGEYAYDFVTVNAHYGATRNPHDLTRSAGGSSGGSGAAVAGGLGAISLGTDTNGSIRVPSSFCGIWGLKPGYGQLSRAGGFLFSGSLDTIGVLGRDVADLASSFDAMAGHDARDPVCRTGAPEPAMPSLDAGLSGLRISRLGGYFRKGWTDDIAAIMQAVGDALDLASDIELPKPELARSAAYAITATEGGEFHRHRLRQRAADYDPADRDRFLAGSLVPAEWYLQAQRFRTWWHHQMQDVFANADILIAPATPLAAPLLDQTNFELDGVAYPLRPNIGLWTQPITLIGLPVVAAPVHIPGQLPLAVQIIGKPGSEPDLLRVARFLEASGTCAAPVAGTV
ncbi:AtzE family amidohydrolase [Croceicoccus ponticola]|uniref:AtzE family amidohydrolase n=1 Tax=Croceicoccus ponticola TaxID=2217664 RepID=A0A437GUH0_9SPHN|nr:AtzE family amidohydrolase [Croceicoccus ponticola]RVQ65138.1 AtzE family amidohydrolase [Croceicoccus ponticola]